MSKPLHAVTPLKQAPLDQDIDLPGGQRLELRVEGDESIVRISKAGTNVLNIRITDQGAELVFEDGLQLRSEGEVCLDSDRLTLRAREELRLESEGEVNIKAKGDMSTEARIQNIRSRLGNVNVKANDDVKLRGERILLNT